MSVLIPMSTETFGLYLDAAIAGYAEQNVTSGRWPQEGSLERSRIVHDKLLPQGLATPNHYLFEIRDAASDAVVGSLWLGVSDQSGFRVAYVYDVRVNADRRRRGHAKRAFKALEPIAKSLGLSTIALHVFAYNKDAIALYEALGYGIAGLNMHKHLE